MARKVPVRCSQRHSTRWVSPEELVPIFGTSTVDAIIDGHTRGPIIVNKGCPECEQEDAKLLDRVRGR